MMVPWLDLLNLTRLYLSVLPLLPVWISILVESTLVTVPELRATTQEPESLATLASIPVPMIGALALISGTACLCMLEPISALLASSCSRNGIRAVEAETICLGEMSRKSTFSGPTSAMSPLYLT